MKSWFLDTGQEADGRGTHERSRQCGKSNEHPSSLQGEFLGHSTGGGKGTQTV